MRNPLSATILLVEDEGIVASDIQGRLEDMGYRTCGVAASSEEALAMAEACHPDLVLMDIRLRGGADGIATAEQMKNISGAPIVYLTAHADETTLARAKLTEPFGYLVKPVGTEELRSTVEIALHRHALERQIRNRERWFSTTLGSLADAVITVDLEGRVSSLNHAAEILLGVSSELAVGKELLQFPAFEAEPPPVQAVVASLQPILEQERTLVGGPLAETRIVMESVAPVVDGQELLGAVVVLRDITERRKLRQQLETADRLASLGTMAAGIAHEINNPLAAVLSNIEALRASLDALDEGSRSTGDEMYEILGDTVEGVVRIARIVSDLRVFARPVEPTRKSVDLATCVEWAVRTTASEFRHRAPVRVELDDVFLVRADRTRLEQVLVNLLVNAAHAIPAGFYENNEVMISAQKTASDTVRVQIKDSGVGIHERDVDRIFEPFFTTKDVGHGTGLGLSICQGIVRSFGGTIEVESTPGKGTTMSVLLPTAEVPRRSTIPVAAPEYQVGKVLLIVDDDLVPRAVGRVLANHRLTCVTGAGDALALLEEERDFDVILSDLMMPGMTGKAFYDALALRFPDLVPRVIFLTGGATEEEFEEFLQRIPNPCVEKPFEGNTLRAAIGHLVNGVAPLG